jgi:hypothetical protein
MKVVGARFTGSSCIVRLRAGEFVKDLNDSTFRGSLTDSESALLPRWEMKPEVGPVLNGKFFFSIAANLQAYATSDLVAFENTAIALVAHKDFSDPHSRVFYTVSRVGLSGQGIGEVPSSSTAKDGWYELSSGEHYQMDVYSFVPPKADLKSSKLHIDSDVKTVEFPLGDHRDIDSRYDIKQFSFQAPEQIQTLSAGVRLYLTGPGDQDTAHSDITIPIRFRGSLRLAIGRILLIGLGTSGPGIVAAQTVGKLNFGVAVLMLFLGFMAATGTVFTSLKKT